MAGRVYNRRKKAINGSVAYIRSPFPYACLCCEPQTIPPSGIAYFAAAGTPFAASRKCFYVSVFIESPNSCSPMHVQASGHGRHGASSADPIRLSAGNETRAKTQWARVAGTVAVAVALVAVATRLRVYSANFYSGGRDTRKASGGSTIYLLCPAKIFGA